MKYEEMDALYTDKVIKDAEIPADVWEKIKEIHYEEQSRNALHDPDGEEVEQLYFTGE